MFEDWKQAWRDAVENFEREIRADETGGLSRTMRSQLASARGALARLDLEIDRASTEAAAERDAEQVCVRRQSLAAGIGDTETEHIAGQYAGRHAERAGIYERKTAVLRDERELLVRDIETMEQEIGTREDDPERLSDAYEGILDDEAERERIRQEREFARIRRERSADDRLEELKRRMRE